MSIDTRFTPAIRNALLEQMRDLSGRQAPGHAAHGNTSHSRTAPTDSISLSDDALRLQAASNTLAGQNVFDAERVAELKLAVTSGIYRVDPERVAAKFLHFNQNL